MGIKQPFLKVIRTKGDIMGVNRGILGIKNYPPAWLCLQGGQVN